MKDVEENIRNIVGVNHAIMEGDLDIEGQVIDPEIAVMQLEKLQELRSMRDSEVVNKALTALTEASKTDENLFPLILHAVKVYCSVGEIMNSLKVEFGTWMSPSGV